MHPDEAVRYRAARQFAAERVAAAMGGPRPTDVVLLQRRRDYWVLRCTSAASQESAVVKLAGPDCAFALSFARTAAVTSRAAVAGVPVPRVFASADDYRDGPWRYLVQEFVTGREWRELCGSLSGPDAADAYDQLADVMVALEGVRFDAFGSLGDAGRPTSGLDLRAALEARARATISSKRDAAAFVALLRRESSLFEIDQPPSLCHDDLHHGNVIFDRDGDRVRLRAVLDWDKAWAGPHESDLARLALWDDMTSPGFWSSYRARCPQAEGAERRLPIFQLLWCLEYDAATPRHRRDTDRLARLLDVELRPLPR